MLNPLAKAGGYGTETRQNKQKKKSQTAQSDKIWFRCKKKQKKVQSPKQHYNNI